MIQLTQKDIDRFWKKVEKTDDCWLWTASIRGKCGYGCFKINGTIYSAHRIAYQIAYNNINDDLLICHKCDNKICVKPDHLFQGTAQDNVIDMFNKGREGVINRSRKIAIIKCIVCGTLKELRQKYIKNTYFPNHHPQATCSRSCGTKLGHMVKNNKITYQEIEVWIKKFFGLDAPAT